MKQESYSMDDLLDIMRALRDPKTGCPWDQKQDFKTIAPYTIEEAYEVSDAITRNDMEDLCDELGDLLLQVVYHAQMAKEDEFFSFDDVVNAVCNKMVRRHPHVFGSDEELKSGKQDWELMKKQERLEKGENDHSALANISVGLASLVRARKLQKKAAKVNFDWPSYHGVLDKLQEEIGELKEAIESNRSDLIEDEMGDVIFSTVNLCRHMKVDADIALQRANRKFETRFRRLEKIVSEQGNDVASLSIDELEDIWHQAKSFNNIEKSTA